MSANEEALGVVEAPCADSAPAAVASPGGAADVGGGTDAADAGGADEAGGADVAGSYPSKKAKKRALKEQWYEQKKQRMKEQKKEAKAQRREASQAKWESLSPEEQAEMKRNAAAAREARVAALNQEAAARSAAADTPLPTCVVDLSFDDKMNDREIASLAQQLSYCHSANRRAAFPMRVVFTSVGGKLEAKLNQNTGWRNWAITPEPRSYLEAFADRHANIVYLSSESETALDTLDSSEVYIIGGLVDHNREKGLTHRLATEARVRTARLPIDEHLAMSQRRVLAVNHVVEILALRATGLDWTSTFMKVMPERRQATARDGDAPDDAADGDPAALGQDEGEDAAAAAGEDHE